MPVPQAPTNRTQPSADPDRQRPQQEQEARPAQSQQQQAPVPFIANPGLSTLVDVHTHLIQLLSEQLQYLQISSEYNYRLLSERLNSVSRAQQPRPPVPDLITAVNNLRLAQSQQATSHSRPDNIVQPPEHPNNCQCLTCLRN